MKTPKHKHVSKPRCLSIPVDEIDWELLREQRAYLGTVSQGAQLLPPAITDAMCGIENLLAYLQEAAAKVLGRKTARVRSKQRLGKEKLKTITVTLQGGLVADVDGIPPGYRVRVLDMDVEGMFAEDLVKLPDGKQAFENIWAANAA